MYNEYKKAHLQRYRLPFQFNSIHYNNKYINTVLLSLSPSLTPSYTHVHNCQAFICNREQNITGTLYKDVLSPQLVRNLEL